MCEFAAETARFPAATVVAIERGRFTRNEQPDAGNAEAVGDVPHVGAQALNVAISLLNLRCPNKAWSATELEAKYIEWSSKHQNISDFWEGIIPAAPDDDIGGEAEVRAFYVMRALYQETFLVCEAVVSTGTDNVCLFFLCGLNASMRSLDYVGTSTPTGAWHT